MAVLGFMSGTSLDGVDVAILETDGETVEQFGPAIFEPYSPDERAIIQAATDDIVAQDRAWRPIVADPRAVEAVTAAHRRAIDAIRGQGARFDLIGFHGQTMLHRPRRARTLQIGDAAELAAYTNVPVVATLRAADLAGGGEGAPLVPVYHRALYARLGFRGPVAFLNIGGVANVSWIDGDQMIAADVGPGNGLIDQYVQRAGLGLYDCDGRLAAQGRVDDAALENLLAHRFFASGGPRSLDRYDFSLAPVDGLAVADAVATLTAFTVEAIARSMKWLPALPAQWVVCGGGCHNPVIMAGLRRALGVPVEDCAGFGLRGDFIEAEAMAFVAARHRRGLPSTFPATTGVETPTVAGELILPQGASL